MGVGMFNDWRALLENLLPVLEFRPSPVGHLFRAVRQYALFFFAQKSRHGVVCVWII